DRPDELAAALMERMRHGVTEVRVHGMYSDTDKFMLVCIINKRQIGEMMKIIKSYPGTFASFTKVTEVFGNFKRRVR
ncbi:MAG: YitT family protein, partial [Clostridia bacterium]|nr:YitT family protein [Clostridia bacterium]